MSGDDSVTVRQPALHLGRLAQPVFLPGARCWGAGNLAGSMVGHLAGHQAGHLAGNPAGNLSESGGKPGGKPGGRPGGDLVEPRRETWRFSGGNLAPPSL